MRSYQKQTKTNKMSKEIVLTQEELETEIRQAFIHGQGNKEMMRLVQKEMKLKIMLIIE